ncbi:hypothetical protein GCM10025867_16430 [Frondihabitans sucicola]|uniref:Uncharacterized protein n=1 Tax=Frondihabitans sucicola TaxID=1268041 RepID=A0ABM8GLW3_9MICO|nr:hypothetical protein [Frondihabitans sucicola]BDZ49402.1 hypothetical protein GCM10025867_16430 [Frondihabitans sucicola]
MQQDDRIDHVAQVDRPRTVFSGDLEHADVSGVARDSAHDDVVGDDADADSGPEVDEQRVLRVGRLPGPAFGDDGRDDVLVEQRGESCRRRDAVPDRHVVPLGQERRIQHGPRFGVDRPRRGDAHPGDPRPVDGVLVEDPADPFADAREQSVGGVAGGRRERGAGDDAAGQVEEDDGHQRRIEVHADRVRAGGIERQQRARLSHSAAGLAGDPDHPDVHEALADVRDGLRRQTRGRGELDAAEPGLGTPDVPEDDRFVQVGQLRQVGAAAPGHAIQALGVTRLSSIGRGRRTAQV